MKYLSVWQVLLTIVWLAFLKVVTHFIEVKSDGTRDNKGAVMIKAVRTVLKEASETNISSSTGLLFHGLPFRTYQGERSFVRGWQQQHTSTNSHFKNEPSKHPLVSNSTTASTLTCENWAVVTTINEATEAIQRVAALPQSEWCTVIVADTKTPSPLGYLTAAGLEDKASTVHFLSVEDQKEWARQAGGGMVSKFIDSIPYHHFARKNIGFLYAIKYGAKFVFDFDDDNLLLLDDKGSVVDPIKNKAVLEGTRVPVVGKNVFNHHPMMETTVCNSWPRGLPMDSIQDETTQGLLAYANSSLSMDKIAVLQICADGNPDVDAVHRLTKPLPMNFKADTPLVVPPHALAPYNAQATIHTQKALWATLLSATVPGRVSDIWRGYFAQALFRYLDLRLVFLPPSVIQIRNVHSYLADMNAEWDLYFKSSKLVEFLSTEWSSDAESIPELMEELWIALFERGYIEEEDVHLLELWLGALVESNYAFPPIVRRRNRNVVVIGQFNYANDLKSVLFWNQKWRNAFDRVVVRGPWNETQLSALNSWGITSHNSSDDRGHFSPVENLMLTLQEYQNDTGVEGVMYLHDDMYVNIPKLLGSRTSFPTSSIVRSKSWPGNYHVLPDGTFKSSQGEIFVTPENFITSKSLVKWTHWKDCLPAFSQMAQDDRSKTYRSLSDGSLYVPNPGQSDVLYMPTKYASEFVEAAQLFVEYKVFLECAVPSIINMVETVTSSRKDTITLNYLTSWTGTRGKPAMMKGYIPNKHTLVHPMKLSMGLEQWGKHFDDVVLHD